MTSISLTMATTFIGHVEVLIPHPSQLSLEGRVLSHLHFHTLASQPGNEVFLAMVKMSKSDHNPPTADIHPEVRPIIEDEFPDVFPIHTSCGTPPDRGDAMKIETDPNADPPVRPVIRLSIAELDELRKQLDELLAKGFIKPSTSPYGAPVLFVKKKDGTLRMCVDYRGLNRITRKNRHPLPASTNSLIGSEAPNTFRNSTSYRDTINNGSLNHTRTKQHLRCRYGHYEFNVVPFGLTNAPASFSTMMFNVLDPVLDKCVVVYLDDILIYSKTKKEHLQHLQECCPILRQNGLYAKLSKCTFLQEETEFLGHVISEGGVHTNAGLVKAIRNGLGPANRRMSSNLSALLSFINSILTLCNHRTSFDGAFR